MKKLFKKKNIPIKWIFGLLFILYSSMTFGQWLNNGNKLYYNSGEVGIGTNQPTHKLQVNDGYFAVYNGGITVKNPLNELAGFNMNWDNNVARFRLGGQAPGADNGIDFQVTGNKSILRLLNNGNVGIGTTNPVARLEVRTGNPYGFRQIMDISDSFSTSIGIQNDINNDADFGGIFGYLSRITSNTTSSIFGSIIQISGEGENSRFGQIIRVNSNTTGEEGLIRGLQIELGGSISEQPKYGIYVSGSDRNYFSGDLGVRTVHPSFTLDVNGTAGVTGGVWSGSDKRWKQNIEKIEAPLNKIKRLNGKTYDWRNDEFPEKEFSMDRQIGFLAQEVQEIFPELVKENNEGYLAINYIGIIPVLVEALKEQQEAIETLQEEMEELRGKTNSTPSKSRDYSSSTIDETSIPAELFQNIPNPFIGETEISFFLPQEVGTAEIILYNLQGTQIRSIPISERGEGNIRLNGFGLSPGIYLYALVADGVWIDTKKMLLR